MRRIRKGKNTEIFIRREIPQKPAETDIRYSKLAHPCTYTKPARTHTQAFRLNRDCVCVMRKFRIANRMRERTRHNLPPRRPKADWKTFAYHGEKNPLRPSPPRRKILISENLFHRLKREKFDVYKYRDYGFMHTIIVIFFITNCIIVVIFVWNEYTHDSYVCS